jgi:hypothetical protein
MLLRLVRPVKRSGSSIPQFVKRIPADVRDLAVGKSVAIPLGDSTVLVVFTQEMDAVRFSLRTREPTEAKARQAAAIAALELFWKALRDDRPANLSHKQCTALAGDLYRAWTDERERTLAMVYSRDLGWTRESVSPDEEAAYFADQSQKLSRLAAWAEAGDLETPLGPIVDRLLIAKGY